MKRTYSGPPGPEALPFRSRATIWFSICLLGWGLVAGEASAQGNRIELGDLALEANLSEPRISPDGARIVFVVSRPDYEDNTFVRQLVLASVDDGSSRPITHQRPRVHHPRWSPDGARLAFLDQKDENDKPQIYIMSLGGGEARRITRSPRGVTVFAWRPNGEDIAFVTDDEPGEKTGVERHNKSFEVGDNSFLATAAPVPSQIWLVPAEGGEPERLTTGPESVSASFGAAISWSPDGKSIAFLSQARPHSGEMDRRSLRVVDVTTKTVRDIVPGPAAVGSPEFSPDGAHLAFSRPTGPEPGFNPDTMFVVPLSGGKPSIATPQIDRDLSGTWLPDGKSLLVFGSDLTRVSLWVQPLGGAPRKIDLGRVNPASAFTVSKNGVLAFIGAEPDHPEEIYFLASTDAAPERLTEENSELASRRLGAVETITWNGPDGFEQNGVLIYPPDYVVGKKYPLVLSIHGGPMGTSTEAFSAFRQILAARDWIVFSPNYRGSNNQGRAFQRAVINDAGDGPGRDVMSGVKALEERRLVDEDRIAVSGWSYGGYMTTWLTAHYQVWKVAVAGAAVTDWFDWYNLADMNIWSGYGLGGSPWLNDNAGAYWDQSPIKYAHNIRTPTLILSNTGDPRVTVTQSYKLYHALKDNGVPVQFIAYPIPGHFPGDPIHQRDVYRRWLEWIRDHFETSTTDGSPVQRD